MNPFTNRLDYVAALNWRVVGQGTLAARPATCEAAKDVYICIGTGCTASKRTHYCTATNTWEVQGGITSAGGADTQVQYNTSGALGGDANFVWNDPVYTGLGIGGGKAVTLRNAATKYLTQMTPANFIVAEGVAAPFDDVNFSAVFYSNDTGKGTVELRKFGTGVAPDWCIQNNAEAGGATCRWRLYEATGNVLMQGDLLSGVTGKDLGSTTQHFRDLYLHGLGTYGTNYFKFTGTPTAPQTITIPNETGTLCTTGSVCSGYQASGTLSVYKTSDQEVTTTTLTNDAVLAVTLAASSKYACKFDLYVLNDGAAEGFKIAVTGTVGITSLKAQASIYDDTLNTLVGFARVAAIDTAVGAALSSGDNRSIVEASINTSTSGTFLISWAQNAAGASAGVHVQPDSSMVCKKI